MQNILLHILYFFLGRKQQEIKPVILPPPLKPLDLTPAVKPVPISDSSMKKLNKLHPMVKKRALIHLQKAFEHGILLAVTQGLRTMEEQQALFNKGRDAAGNIIDRSQIVTNAKAGDSFHNFSLAYDVAISKDGKIVWEGDWELVGRLGEEAGMTWGGRFKSIVDLPHFQFSNGLTLSDLKAGKKLPDVC